LVVRGEESRGSNQDVLIAGGGRLGRKMFSLLPRKLLLVSESRGCGVGIKSRKEQKTFVDEEEVKWKRRRGGGDGRGEDLFILHDGLSRLHRTTKQGLKTCSLLPTPMPREGNTARRLRRSKGLH